MEALPPCGIYRTTRPLGEAVPAGRLVYFHNHGEPGPGVYLPAAWKLNRARFHDRGTTVTDPAWAATLEPLAPEGLYRVKQAFHCCPQRCRQFEQDLLVQLGYDGEGRALLFVPEWTESGLAVAELGTRLEMDRVRLLAPLKVATSVGSVGHGERELQ